MICLDSFFLMFGLWASDFLIFDLKIGFLVKNCIYRQLGMSRIPSFDEKNQRIKNKLFGIVGSKFSALTDKIGNF